MKLHHLTTGIWDHHHEPDASLSLGCKRLRPLAPRLTTTNPRGTEEGNDCNSPRVIQKVETHPGGTRWNPTQEQIGILEMLYGGGMRTPNAQQIEQITSQLVKYGKIEGKNVFYWFQNHKARERQKQKRDRLAYVHFPRTLSSISAVSCEGMEDHAPSKRKSRGLGVREDGSSVVLKTLELFPLRPQGGRIDGVRPIPNLKTPSSSF